MIRLYVTWCAQDYPDEVRVRIHREDQEGVQRLQQRLKSADDTVRMWADANGGQVVKCGDGEGVLAIPADRLADVPKLAQKYAELMESRLAVGVGARMTESAVACEVSRRRGEMVLYRPGIEKELEQKQDDFSALLGKAETGMGSVSTVKGVDQPDQAQSEHSDAQVLESQINDPDRPAPSEQTHEANDLVDQLHDLAGAQQPQVAGGTPGGVDPLDGLRRRVAVVLEQVRQQKESFTRLKQEDPQAYASTMALLRAVIDLGRALGNGPPQALAKSTNDESLAVPGAQRTWHISHNGNTFDLLSDSAEEGLLLHSQHHSMADASAVLTQVDPDFKNRQAGVSGTIQPGQHVTISNWDNHGPGTVIAVHDDMPKTNPATGGLFELRDGARFHPNHVPGVVHGVTVRDEATGQNRYFHHIDFSPSGHADLRPPHGWLEVNDGHMIGGLYTNASVTHTPYAPADDENVEKAELPAGTMKPSGSGIRGQAGSFKTKHGASPPTWKQGRAGLITTTTDRHAPPILGTASHPTSSRSPTSR